MCPPRRGEMGVLCPKPRRPARSDPISLLPRPSSSGDREEPLDSRAEVDVHHIFFVEGGETGQMDSSPPFFCGSPPSRPANPVVGDPCFGKQDLIVAHSLSNLTVSPSASGRNGICAQAKFGLKPPAVRIEGFDCLNRGRRQGCSITAVA